MIWFSSANRIGADGTQHQFGVGDVQRGASSHHGP